MLELREHIRLCSVCAEDLRETDEVRRLLRALLPYSPPAGAEQRLISRLDRRDDTAWNILVAALAGLRQVPSLRLHSRRLPTALALSSIVLLAVAAPVAPPLGDAAVANAGAMATLPPVSASLLPLPSAGWPNAILPFFRLTSTAAAPPPPTPSETAVEYGAGEAEPLRDETAVDYVQGDVALADYQAASGAR